MTSCDGSQWLQFHNDDKALHLHQSKKFTCQHCSHRFLCVIITASFPLPLALSSANHSGQTLTHMKPANVARLCDCDYPTVPYRVTTLYRSYKRQTPKRKSGPKKEDVYIESSYFSMPAPNRRTFPRVRKPSAHPLLTSAENRFSPS